MSKLEGMLVTSSPLHLITISVKNISSRTQPAQQAPNIPNMMKKAKQYAAILEQTFRILEMQDKKKREPCGGTAD